MSEFSPSRSGEIQHRFVPPNWHGQIQTDGAEVYPGVFKHSPGVVRFECVGHLCRYVLEAVKAHQMQAVPLLKDITELNAIGKGPANYLAFE